MGYRTSNPKTSLRKAMNLRGVTNKELSEMTGIPEGTLQQAACGYCRLRPERVEKCAKALNVTVEELRDIWGTKPSTDFLAPKPKKEKPASDVKHVPITEIEKLWLHVHQLQRRVAVLERGAR